VLLLAPLAQAAGMADDLPLRARRAAVLTATTVADARDAFAAIRLANPGGLGRVESQDVVDEPTVTLREAMALAAGRDAIAREYVSDFAITFDIGAPALARARGDGLPWADATVETYLVLLAAVPDTLVARRLGAERAAEISRQASDVLHAGGVRSSAGREAVAELDRMLRDERNSSNPGTTADLTASSLFVNLVLGGWP
jgi:triphosphoribosyl-dephospho-CoA synthase